jgi:hypothetical protein
MKEIYKLSGSHCVGKSSLLELLADEKYKKDRHIFKMPSMTYKPSDFKTTTKEGQNYYYKQQIFIEECIESLLNSSSHEMNNLTILADRDPIDVIIYSSLEKQKFLKNIDGTINKHSPDYLDFIKTVAYQLIIRYKQNYIHRQENRSYCKYRHPLVIRNKDLVREDLKERAKNNENRLLNI